MAIRTVYENNRSDKNFYAVEKTGFTKVNELMYQFVEDIRNIGAVTVANVYYVEANASTTGSTTLISAATASNRDPNLTVYDQSWPIAQRVRKIKNPGVGYEVNQILTYYDGAAASNLKIKITSVNTMGGITGFDVLVRDSYTTATNISKPLVYDTVSDVTYDPVLNKYSLPTGSNPPVTSVSSYFRFQSMVTANIGFAPNVVPLTSYSYSLSTGPDGSRVTWQNAHGTNGEGPPGDKYTMDVSYNPAITTGTRWPVDGIWVDEPFADVNKPDSLILGSEIFLIDDNSGNNMPGFTSVIPPGTYITGLYPIDVVYGVPTVAGTTFVTSGPSSSIYKETTTTFTWMTVNNPISIRKGDRFGLRGRGFAIDDTTSMVPEKFRVILEASAKMDPLNDTIGTTANVVSSSGNVLLVNNMATTQTNMPPMIYAGQRVTSLLVNGTVSGVVTVLSANVSGTTANIRLSSNQTITAGEPLRFRFDAAQPWRMAIDVPNSQSAIVIAGTEIQLKDDGNISFVSNSTGVINDIAGLIGNVTGTGGVITTANIDTAFINRSARIGTAPEAFPMSYIISQTNRGVFFGVWEGNWAVIHKSATRQVSDKDNWFNWFLIQRPVDRVTGRVLTTGRAPVFCINSVGYKYWKFIVRESDAMHPTQGDPEQYSQYYDLTTKTVRTQVTPYRVPADQHTDDSYAILNTTNQIALSEDSKYLISFLHNLTTPRFRYSEELDMLGQTSADVCMASNDISITAYQESTPRTYRALPANKPYNTGMRICVIKDVQ